MVNTYKITIAYLSNSLTHPLNHNLANKALQKQQAEGDDWMSLANAASWPGYTNNSGCGYDLGRPSGRRPAGGNAPQGHDSQGYAR